MIAYLDCFSGISGDMLLGALVDAGLPLDDLRGDLACLPLSGYEITAAKVTRAGIAGTQVSVQIHEEQVHRGLRDILEIINSSSLPGDTKETSCRVFTRLAEAEARVHDRPVEEVHLHEVGAVDAIVDVVGACCGLRRLGVTELHSSPLPLGGGWVNTAHGRLPVPAPATVELLRGVPACAGPVQEELVTPTGAAIVTTLSRGFGPMPSMIISGLGWGAGARDLPHPNLLRLFLGEPAREFSGQRLTLVETNLDDMNPELFEHLMDRLLAAGALDVFYTPIVMKKSRPATLVSVLARPEDVQQLTAILFQETTTLGVRFHEVSRHCLGRQSVEVETEYGRVRVKLGLLGSEVVTAAPEYEDCRRLANERGVPLKLVYQAAAAAVPRVGTSAQVSGPASAEGPPQEEGPR